jgi:predicted RNA-binding protein (virulence factor B family)
MRRVALHCERMSDIGKQNTLRVIRKTEHGLYLDAGEHGEAILIGKTIPKGLSRGDTVEVFLFRDLDGRLMATTEMPLAIVGEFAVLGVMGMNRERDAFLDWGIEEDLILPFSEQEYPVVPGQWAVVFLYLDPKTERVFATSMLDKHLSSEPPAYNIGQPVDLIITRETPLGYNTLVEQAHLGLLYHSYTAARLDPGQKVQGYISAIRPDGKIDLTLESSGFHRVMELTEQILEAMKATGGKLALDDSSAPEEIRAAFGASKKAFKQALGALLKQRRIRFTNPGAQLLDFPER